MSKTFILHPILFALYIVFFLFAVNVKELSLGLIYPGIILTTVFALISFLFLRLFIKNNYKSAFLASFLLMMFFSYGHLYSLFDELEFSIFRFNIFPRFSLVIWFFILIVVFYFSIKSKKRFIKVTSKLNLIASILVIFSVLNIVTHYQLDKNNSIEQQTSILSGYQRFNYSAGKNQMPDIYYLIFDRYASNKILKDFLDFDNSEFINYLENKGFYIADESRANYPVTFLSLASSLNMDLVAKNTSPDLTEWTTFYQLIENNAVQQFLRERGYKYIHFSSDWEPTRNNRYADLVIDHGLPFNRFVYRIIRNTPIYPIFDEISIESIRRRVILKTFDGLTEISKENAGPKFVFAHLLIPHPPYVFGKNGDPVIKKETERNSETENYKYQLMFLNQKIIGLVDQLLENSKTAPIIIIQSDEGPYLFLEDSQELNIFDERAVKTRTGILNVYYLPNKDGHKILYKSISPVNSFRLIFNEYFGTELPLLDDNNYIIKNPEYPFRLIEIDDI